MTEDRPIEQGSTALADDAAAATRGGATLLVLQTLSRACGLGFVMLLTRHLDQGNVGRYSAAAAIVVLANFIADFGTSPAITRMVSREKDEADRLLSGTLLPSLLFGMLVAAGVSAFAYVAYEGPAVADVAIASLAIPAASMLSSVLGALDGAGLIARRAVVSAIQTFVIALGVVPVYAGGGIRSAIVALVAAPFVALVLASGMARAAGLWSSALRLDMVQTRRLLRAAVPFAVTGGLTALTLRFDVILLSLTRSAADTAAYDLALRLIEAVAYPATAICAPLLFVLSRRIGRGDHAGAGRAYAQATRVIYAIGLPISVALLILGQPIVSLVFGPSYGDVAMPLAIMGAAQWVTFLVYLEGTLMLAGDAAKRGTIVLAACAGTTVALDVLVVPRFGATGAATVMTASWLISALLLYVFNARTTGIRTPLPDRAVTLATGALAVVLFLCRRQNLAVGLSAGTLVYGAVLLGVGGFDRRDVRRLFDTFTGYRMRHAGS